MKTTRTGFAVKNIIFGYIASALSMTIGLVSRYVFIKYLGITYLGVSGLFSNVLGVLSFAELGIGSAINFSLYKPVAEKNYSKIKALMNLYKKSYQVVFFIVVSIGLALLPFLQFIIKSNDGIATLRELRTFYLIFLANTASSYFVTYKYGLANAEQKTYIQTNLEAISSAIISTLQLVCIVVFQNYLAYLLIGMIANYVIKAIINKYLNYKYPIFKSKNHDELEQNELLSIKNNVKGLIFHRLGEISIYQTDNIIISACIGLQTTGCVANYSMIMDIVSRFTNATFNSVMSSFGNLIAVENEKKQYSVWKQYNFIGFWIYGFCAIMLFLFMTPFIELVFGTEITIDELSVLLMSLDFYLRGKRICVNIFKTAGGVFYQDRYVSFIQAIVNIVLSLLFVKLIGLPGIYLGTLIQGLTSSIIRPYFLYRDILHEKTKEYYIDELKFIIPFLIAGLTCYYIKVALLSKLTIFTLIGTALICILLINGIFIAFSISNYELKMVCSKIFSYTKRDNL